MRIIWKEESEEEGKKGLEESTKKKRNVMKEKVTKN
jgi:hypothetical protein